MYYTLYHKEGFWPGFEDILGLKPFKDTHVPTRAKIPA